MDTRIQQYFGIDKDEWLMIMFETAYSYFEHALVYYDQERTLHTDYEMIRTLTCAKGGHFWNWWAEVFQQEDEKIIISYERHTQIWRRYTSERLKREYYIIHTQINYLPPEGLMQTCKKQANERFKKIT